MNVKQKVHSRKFKSNVIVPKYNGDRIDKWSDADSMAVAHIALGGIVIGLIVGFLIGLIF